jgi:hypothetical protein
MSASFVLIHRAAKCCAAICSQHVDFILGHSPREVNFIARPFKLFLAGFGRAAGRCVPA